VVAALVLRSRPLLSATALRRWRNLPRIAPPAPLALSMNALSETGPVQPRAPNYPLGLAPNPALYNPTPTKDRQNWISCPVSSELAEAPGTPVQELTWDRNSKQSAAPAGRRCWASAYGSAGRTTHLLTNWCRGGHHRHPFWMRRPTPGQSADGHVVPGAPQWTPASGTAAGPLAVRRRPPR